jgi:16S rRNA (cytosine1402-N4)-methyltransferase
VKIKDPARGFSFYSDGPLDMRMNTSQELTAAHIINMYSKSKIADILLNYGGETHASLIADRIVSHRQKIGAIENTATLSNIVCQTLMHHNMDRYCRKSYMYDGQKKSHPATKTFQAIRIAVNDELEELKMGLENSFSMLRPHGHLLVITFHALEDAIVKKFGRKMMSGT